MKVGYVVPVRNKVQHLDKMLDLLLRQSYGPLEIILSDQGSTDGSLEKMEKYAVEYSGPHRITILKCPETQWRGMLGLNTHMNWIHTQHDCDIVMTGSADDLPHVDRAFHTVNAFHKYGPSMVLTGQVFSTPEGEITGRNAYPSEAGWCKPEDMIEKLIGGSTTQAWTRDFANHVFPLEHLWCFDVYLPFLATLDRGAYYVHEMLHSYVKHASADNTGVGGQQLAADETRKAQLNEIAAYQIMCTLCRTGEKAQELGWMTPEANLSITNAILQQACVWSAIRNDLTYKKIPPIPLEV